MPSNVSRAGAFASAFALLSGLGGAQDDGVTVSVRVDNVQSDVGNIVVALFESDEAMDLRRWSYGNGVQARPGTVSVDLTGVPPGRYVVLALHDEDEDQDLDTNFLGVPTEGLGFAGGARAIFAPPDFDRNAIEVRNQAVDLTISLNY